MSETKEQGWKLEELAQQAGVSPRTVRYYVQRGLLPAPVFRGRDTVYSSEHLLRLQVIRQLQEQFWSLDAIQTEIERCSPNELHKLAAGRIDVPLLPASARRSYQPVPQKQPTPAHDEGERWQRWVLTPGLELHLAETADAETQRQADELRKEFARRRARGGF